MTKGQVSFYNGLQRTWFIPIGAVVVVGTLIGLGKMMQGNKYEHRCEIKKVVWITEPYWWLYCRVVDDRLCPHLSMKEICE